MRFFICVIFLSTFCFLPSTSATASTAPRMAGIVNQIIDGNTIYAMMLPGNNIEINARVKILGADTDTDTATDALYQLIPPGTRIWMTRIKDTRDTGTISARVWRDSVNVGEYITRNAVQ